MVRDTKQRDGERIIDLETVIRNKNERTWQLLPWFVIRYLRRIIHEDELNGILSRLKDKQDLEFIAGGINELGLHIQSIGLDKVPKTGRYIVAANHPLGGPEGLALMNEIGKVRQDMMFIVNDILMNLDNIRGLFLPVNKHGSNPKEHVKKIEEVYQSDILVLNFPFGLVSRKHRGVIEDLEWKKSFISKARKHKRDIIPVHINGRNSNFFYFLANLRKFLGIKVNIEMLYLVDEMYKQKNATIKIKFGNPVSHHIFTSEKTDKEWAELMRKHVYCMEKEDNAIDFEWK